MEMSAHRSSTSLLLIVCGGSGLPWDTHEGAKTRPLFGLSTASGAVTPAWFNTFTRKIRVPPSTSSARAGPGATFTRLSGLIVTTTSTCLSRTSCSRVTAARSSACAMASSI